MSNVMAVVAIVLGLVFIVSICLQIKDSQFEEDDAVPVFSVVALACSSIWGGVYYFLGG